MHAQCMIGRCKVQPPLRPWLFNLHTASGRKRPTLYSAAPSRDFKWCTLAPLEPLPSRWQTHYASARGTEPGVLRQGHLASRSGTLRRLTTLAAAAADASSRLSPAARRCALPLRVATKMQLSKSAVNLLQRCSCMIQTSTPPTRRATRPAVHWMHWQQWPSNRLEPIARHCASIECASRVLLLPSYTLPA
jgi:hypothetical protein